MDYRVIWKFEILPTIRHWMPKGAEILSVQVQHGKPQMWVLCNPDEPTEERVFHSVPTGQAFDLAAATYRGTFQMEGGALVFHVFEAAPPTQTQEGGSHG